MDARALAPREFPAFCSPHSLIFDVFTVQGQFRHPGTGVWSVVLKKHDGLKGTDEFVLCNRQTLLELIKYLKRPDPELGCYAVMGARCAEKARGVAMRIEQASARLMTVVADPKLASLFPRAHRLLSEQFAAADDADHARERPAGTRQPAEPRVSAASAAAAPAPASA